MEKSDIILNFHIKLFFYSKKQDRYLLVAPLSNISLEEIEEIFLQNPNLYLAFFHESGHFIFGRKIKRGLKKIVWGDIVEAANDISFCYGELCRDFLNTLQIPTTICDGKQLYMFPNGTIIHGFNPDEERVETGWFNVIQ